MPKISKLLEEIKDQILVIPEFQREFVWSLEQSKQLMVSLFLNYPTGTILVWMTNHPPELKNHPITEDATHWYKVLLDGQQRLTTLYLLIKGEIPPYYKESDITHDPRHLYFNVLTAEFNYYQKQKMEGSPYWKSVVNCFNEPFNAFSLVENIPFENSDEKLKIGSRINDNLVQLRNITNTEYYESNVPSGLEIDKAIVIFDRVNSMGTKLTDAELVLTHISGKWAKARSEMKDKIEEYKKADIKFFFDLDFLTRCIVVLLTKSAIYEKMTEEVFQTLTETNYKETWKRLIKILDYLIPILKASAYLGSSRDISTNNVFIPLIAYLDRNDISFGSTNQKNHFLYWMYLASLWSRYSGQTDQRLDKDVFITYNNTNVVSDLIKEIEDQRGRIEIKPSDLEGHGTAHPLHRMIYILSKYNKAIDWKDGGSLQDTLGDYYSLHIHHIFPQAMLYREKFNSENHLHKQIVNEIANKAFITRDDNYDISDKRPVDYLKEIKNKYPEALKQQMIPTEESLWEVDHYRDFLTIRRQMIADAINSFLENLKGQQEEITTNFQEIISKGENNFIEFKSSLRWDMEQEKVNKDLEYVIAKTISAFMNSEGGKLFIGVNDSGKVIGLYNDYQTVNNKSRDGFLLHLTNIINAYLGKEFNQFIDTKLVTINNLEICVLEISKSAMPVYLKNNGNVEFFVRASASSQPMNIREIAEYVRTHWDN